jgi:arsenite-transporting ATPase
MTDSDAEPAEEDPDAEPVEDEIDTAAVEDDIDVEIVEDDLDVEAVDDIGADAPEYVLYGGKGGVGKTTMAAATGLASAADGVRTLVVSTDPAHSLSDAVGVEVDAEPTRITADGPAWGVEIDPDAAMAETPLFEEDGSFGGLGGMGDMLDSVAPETGDGGAGLSSMPGTDEAAAVQQLLRFMDDDRFERVVVDTAPTGHTLRLLELPDVMDSMVGRALKLRQTIGGVMDRVGGLFGGDGGTEDAGAADGLSEEEVDDLEELQERIERLRGTLRDPARTDFRIVMVPEEMSVLESERLRDRLDAFGIPVGMVVVNRVMEDLADVTGGEVGDAFVSPNLEDCAFCARRWEVQQDALASAQDLFRDHEVARVPLFAEEVRGEESLQLVAACLSA